MNQVENCRIGKSDRCKITGCIWKKTFNQTCEARKVEFERKNLSVKFVQAEDTKAFYSNSKKKKKKSKKKGKFVKEEIKYIEINAKPAEKVKKEEFKFKTASQDDWIKKVKVK